MYIGIMSGTSLDGVDIALIDDDIKLIHFQTYEMENQIRDKIIKVMNNKVSIREVCSLNFEIGQLFARLTNKFIKEFKINKKDIIAIGSHGQTIYHLTKPSKGEVKSTLQLGDGSVIAKLTKIKTIWNFRSGDMALEGEGAPLVPIFDKYFFNKQNAIALNIGGMANITIVDKNIKAFDTGPGNILINEFMEDKFSLKYDKNGDFARKGKIMENKLEQMLNDGYINIDYPKSTGRELYNLNYIQKYFTNEKASDIARTLTELTAKSIVNNIEKFAPNNLVNLIVSGGGVHNSLLMERLQYHFKGKVFNSNQFGINPDAKEAMLFALLAKLRLNMTNGNIKSTTGAKMETILGSIAI